MIVFLSAKIFNIVNDIKLIMMFLIKLKLVYKAIIPNQYDLIFNKNKVGCFS